MLIKKFSNIFSFFLKGRWEIISDARLSFEFSILSSELLSS